MKHELSNVREFLHWTVEAMAQMRPRTVEWRSMYELILEHGRQWQAAPLPSGIKRGIYKHCFYNAYNLAKAHPELTYVEGLASSIIPVHHAWCVDREGRVVDNTWANPEKCDYYGVPFRLGFVRRFRHRAKLGSMFDHWTKRWPLESGTIPVSEWLAENIWVEPVAA